MYSIRAPAGIAIPGRVCGWLVLATLTVLVTGCLSNPSMRPVAEQNSQNIANYTANVRVMQAHVLADARFRGGIHIQIARNSMSAKLIKLPQQWTQEEDPRNTADIVANADQEPYNTLTLELDKAKLELQGMANLENQSEVEDLVVGTYPLVADVILETPGFTLERIVLDAFKLKDLNSRILGTINRHEKLGSVVRNELISDRNELLDAYAWVRLEQRTVDRYLEGVVEFLDIVEQQGRIAGAHAAAISAFGDGELVFESVGALVGDTELHGRVIDLVRDKAGVRAAEQVESFLDKTDDVLAVLEQLRK